jgi:hypothetical protein
VSDQCWMVVGRTSPQQIAEVVGDDAEEQPHVVGPEAVFEITRREAVPGGSLIVEGAVADQRCVTRSAPRPS